VSSAVVHIRLKAFEVKFKNIVSEERRRRRSRSLSFSSGRLPFTLSISRQGTVPDTRQVVPQGPGPFHRVSLSRPCSISSVVSQEQKQSPGIFKAQSRRGEANTAPSTSNSNETDEQGHVIFTPDTKPAPQEPPSKDWGSSRPRASTPRTVNKDADTLGRDRDQERAGTHEKDGLTKNSLDHLFGSFRIGRNSTFHNLTEAQREKLGGVEYRAITFLSIIVPVYFVLWQLLGCLGIGAYLAKNKASLTRQNGINPWYAFSEVVG
jgi:Cation transport protein